MDFSFVMNCMRNESKSFHEASDKWFIDSGASMHMCNNQETFPALNHDISHGSVSVGDGKVAHVGGKGSVYAHATVDGNVKTVAFNEKLYVPSLLCNLISVSRLRNSGWVVIFDENKDQKGLCHVIAKTSKRVILVAVERDQNGFYEAIMKPFNPEEQPDQIVKPFNTENSQIKHSRHGLLAVPSARCGTSDWVM